MTKPKSKIYFHSIIMGVISLFYNTMFVLFDLRFSALSTILCSYRTQSGNLLTLFLGMHRSTVL